MKPLLPIVSVISLLATPALAQAEAKRLTILHTNDMHSHLSGFSPSIDYTPATTGDDATFGGWARIATVIKRVRQETTNPVLVLDSGDMHMGSAFHLVAREEAIEFRLMSAMGYDAATLGNHEFDLKPRGLERILRKAQKAGGLFPFVLANAQFSETSLEDDGLAAIFSEGLVKSRLLIEKDGLKIGIFGIMGPDSAEVAPFADPVTFSDPFAAARREVAGLRQEGAQIIICLFHGGLDTFRKVAEDGTLARKVDGIDVILSGHTHALSEKPMMVKQTAIVQAGEYGQRIGKLDLEVAGGKVKVIGYRSIVIDDSIAGDGAITSTIDQIKPQIDEQALAATGLRFDQIIAETGFDLTIHQAESNLGNLIADGIRWRVDKNDEATARSVAKVDVAVISNGLIRDDLLAGKTGQIALIDAFASIPLGIGFDETESMGYPLIEAYIYPSELKKAFEILTSIYPLKGNDYYLQISGAKLTYNPRRMLFDRVTEIWLGDEEKGYTLLDYGSSNRRLLRVTADIYNATFLKIVGRFTWGILEIVPKNAQGQPVDDLRKVRLDADPNTPGIQELKEWVAVVGYLRSFPDTDGDGVPDVPERYRGPTGRIRSLPSWNPAALLRRGSYVTWGALGISVVVLTVLVLVCRWFWRRLRRRRHS
jgi:5'-nucleotidase/UDP-sugar diphosphatase